MLVDDGGLAVLNGELNLAVSNMFPVFVDRYGPLRDGLKRVKNMPIGIGYNKVYDAFEGTYRVLLAEEQINKLFANLQVIGNAIALADMLDIALVQKRATGEQIASYLFMTNEDEREIFTTFDEHFQTTKKHFERCRTRPGPEEVVPPFLRSVFATLCGLVGENEEVFEEKSANPTDFPSLTGFASVWSILEFLFGIKEVNRKVGADTGADDQGSGGFSAYGEGVHIGAAAVLCATGQRPLRDVLSVGDHIMRYVRLDIAVVRDELVDAFLTYHKLVRACIEHGTASVAPLMRGGR